MSEPVANCQFSTLNVRATNSQITRRSKRSLVRGTRGGRRWGGMGGMKFHYLKLTSRRIFHLHSLSRHVGPAAGATPSKASLGKKIRLSRIRAPCGSKARNARAAVCGEDKGHARGAFLRRSPPKWHTHASRVNVQPLASPGSARKRRRSLANEARHRGMRESDREKRGAVGRTAKPVLLSPLYQSRRSWYNSFLSSFTLSRRDQEILGPASTITRTGKLEGRVELPAEMIGVDRGFARLRSSAQRGSRRSPTKGCPIVHPPLSTHTAVSECASGKAVCVLTRSVWWAWLRAAAAMSALASRFSVSVSRFDPESVAGVGAWMARARPRGPIIS